MFPNGFTLRLSLSFSPSLSRRAFLHPASFSLMAHTCQGSGRGTTETTCARAMLVHPRSEHNVLLTVHTSDCANLPVQTAPSPGAWCLCEREQNLLVMCTPTASRGRYCSNASGLQTEPPKTAIIASSRIFLLPQWACN